MNGFLGRSVDGVLLGTRSVLENADGAAALDEQVCPVPWRPRLFEGKEKLKIGW